MGGMFSHPGRETVRLVGGRRLPPERFRKPAAAELTRVAAEARDSVVCLDLKGLGITDCGTFPVKFRGVALTMELFFDHEPMQLARWPNEGWATVRDVIDRGGKYSTEKTPDGKPGNGTFVYGEERPARWNVSEGVWLHGYWCHDWYDEAIKIAGIDVARKRITLAAPHGYGLGPSHKWNKAPRRYYALNLLEELDAPGEWYVDAKRGVLYFWPPSDLRGAETIVSVLTAPVITLKHTSFTTVQGMTVECTRGNGVVIAGGRCNALVASVIRNTGMKGVALSGRANRVVGCDVYQTGSAGISMNGGSRATLERGDNVVENNHIHHFARRQRTYAGAVHVQGVGNRAAHNLIHSCPHVGVPYGGNDNVIEFNEIFLTCQETGDVGALYTGRDWGTQGNVIRHNFIHHTGGVRGWSMGVYLDDCDSGDSIVGNVFYRVTRAAFIGGGRNNLVDNNIFVDCSPAVHVDERGKSRIKWNAGLRDSWDLEAKLKRYKYQAPPWSERYPHLVNILQDQPELPLHNTIVRNVAVGGKWLNARGAIGKLLNLSDNYVTDKDPGFVDPDTLDFRLREDSPAWTAAPGFKPIPVERIGLYRDPLRASWPVVKPACEGGLAAPKAAAPERQAALPVFKVPKAAAGIEVDGTIRAEEWRDADAAGVMTLARHLSGAPAKPVSHAWLMAGEAGLFVAVENQVSTSKPLQTGNVWGTCDAVEIALAAPVLGKDAIVVFRGFTTGHWECSDEAGAPDQAVESAARGVTYAAKVVSAAKWTAEWSIPWQALGLKASSGRKLPFNLTVRKTADELWLMWQGSRGYSWQVENTGFIQLP